MTAVGSRLVSFEARQSSSGCSSFQTFRLWQYGCLHLRCRQLHRSVRCSSLDQTRREQALRPLPVAPPPRGPAPPPPPLPPPSPRGESLKQIGLAAIVGVAMAMIWTFNITGQPPTVMEVDATFPDGRPGKMHVVKTKGGNLLQVSQDERGRLFFVDTQGNLYYDSGIKEVGFYFVGRDNEVFNFNVGPRGESVRTYVGNMKDLVTARVDDIGGIPVTELSQAFQQGRGDSVELTLFYDPSSEYELPPNAPMARRKDGSIQGPPSLDEGAILFEKMKQWMPFTKDTSDPFASEYRRGIP